MLSRSPKSKRQDDELSDEQLRALPPGFSDERSPYYVPPELRPFYAAEAGDLRKQRDALVNVQEGLGPDGWLTTTDERGRTVTATPLPTRLRVHNFYMSTARVKLAMSEEAAASARRRQESRDDVSRCVLCGEPGTDPHPATGAFLANPHGCYVPAYGIAGRAVRLHPACAAAVNAAARERVDPALVDRAAAFLDTLA